MKSNELVKLLNLPDSTLRKYAQDYAEYLSPSTANRHREYTEHDARVLKLIVDMKAEKVSPDNIEVTLSSLKAGDWSQLPALNESSKAIVPTQDNMIAAQNVISRLEAQVETMSNDHRREVERLQAMMKDATADRDDLLRRATEAELLLKLYESGRLAPKRPD